MKEISTNRIVIVGAGLGALYAALRLAPRPVVVISPEELGKGASSAWAQGGVAAAMDTDDSPDSHAEDTVRAGAGIVDEAVAKFVTQEARDHILDLTEIGTPFDRTIDGTYVLSREAGHSFARVVRVKGDQAGAQIMAALVEKIRNTPSVQVLEHTMAVALDVENDQITGVPLQFRPCDNAQPPQRVPALLLDRCRCVRRPVIRRQIGHFARRSKLRGHPASVCFPPASVHRLHVQLHRAAQALHLGELQP